MTKQKEIREGVERLLPNIEMGGLNLKRELAHQILSYLHSQGIRLPDGSSLVEELDTPLIRRINNGNRDKRVRR